MLILSSALTQSLLDPDRLRHALASAMAELSAGRASLPPRIAAYVKELGARSANTLRELPLRLAGMDRVVHGTRDRTTAADPDRALNAPPVR